MKKRYVYRVMRLLILFSVAGLMHVSAATYSQTVTLRGKDLALAEVLQAIRQQTDFTVFGAGSILKGTHPVTVDAVDMPLADFLNTIFADQPLEAKIEDKTIVLARKPNDRAAVSDVGEREELPQDLLTVTGKVTDTAGNRFPHATVKIKGTDRATLTDSNGEFALTQVLKDATIVVSYMGYITQELPAAVNMAVILRFAVTDLKEVTINTGYQNISRERFVGSYAQLDSSAFHQRAGVNIIDRLDGTVPGVLFDKKGIGVQIRGISTLPGLAGTSTAPLIVVDNFPFTGDINMINQHDVQDITVLKDAAAASVWGTKAGNGVIVITTKKGRYNQPLRVSINSNVTIQEKPDLFYYPTVSASEFIDLETFLFDRGYYNASLANTTNWPMLTPVPEILHKLSSGVLSTQEAESQINALRGIDVRKELDKHVYRNPVALQHHISLNGGSDLFQYTFSAGFNQNTSGIKSTGGSNQYTINSVNTFRPVKRLEFEAGMNISKSLNEQTGFTLDNDYPYMQLKDAAGTNLAVARDYRLGYIDSAGGGKLLDWHYRPLDEIGFADHREALEQLRLNFRGAYSVTPWLKAELSYQYLQQTGRQRDNYSLRTYDARDMINRFSRIDNDVVIRAIPLGGILDIGNTTLTSQNWRGQLNLNRSWGGRHAISSIMAGEISESRLGRDHNRFYGYNDATGTSASGLNYTDFFPTYEGIRGSAQIPQLAGISEDGEINRVVSLIGNFSYTYDERYSVFGSARRDGANIFGVNTNNKWKPLWSAGLGWDISREQFLDAGWVSYLRLRASLGYMGNVNNRFSGLSTIFYNSDPAPYTQLTWSGAGNPPNPDLRWEQVKMVNAGVDFSLWRGRLSGSAEVFEKTSTDIIAPVPFDPTIGVDNFIVNSASLEGKGIDLSLNSRNTTGALTWESRFGFSYTNTVVTEVYDGGFRARDYISYGVNPSVGKVAYGISSYRWAELDATGDPQGYLDGAVSKDYFAIFEDSVANQVFHGSALPLYYGFLGNSFAWKNILISVNLAFQFKFYFRTPTISYSELLTTRNGHGEYAARWQEPGDETLTNVPSLVYPVNADRDHFYQFASVNVQRGDHIRLQDIRLQYDLNKLPGKRVPFNSMQLFVYCNNLNVIVWRKNGLNLDPAFSGGSDPTSAPIPRTWAAGISIGL